MYNDKPIVNYTFIDFTTKNYVVIIVDYRK